MADGEFTVKLDEAAARRLQAAADAAGQPVDQYAADLISEFLLPDEGVEADLQSFAEYERTGVSYSVEEAMGHFREELHKQVKKAR